MWIGNFFCRRCVLLSVKQSSLMRTDTYYLVFKKKRLLYDSMGHLLWDRGLEISSSHPQHVVINASFSLNQYHFCCCNGRFYESSPKQVSSEIRPVLFNGVCSQEDACRKSAYVSHTIRMTLIKLQDCT
ncbi:UNVERIFIED_CONTAM: hypothetical protein K2H54_035269 [Gekko kuhli]